MSLPQWLAAVFILLTLTGCAQVAATRGQTPYAPYSLDPSGEYPRDRGGDGSGGGGGGEM
jgi:hypothetical protein